MAKILITGATGFVGSHLLEYLIAKKGTDEIFGTYYFDDSLKNFPDLKDKVNFIKVDLNEEQQTQQLIKSSNPDIIFHLAAFTSAADSFSSPKKAVVNNIASQINLLEAIKNSKLLNTKILIISSAEVYGDVAAENLPINEKVEFRPTNPYAVSKLAQDFLGLQYFLAYNLKIIRVRPFNHIGPRQSPNFVVSTFAKKIAEIEKGKRERVLPVGNLNAKRDFTDVRDMVKAYDLVIKNGEIGDVYNIGSGKSYKISDILDRLLAFSTVKITVKTDKSLFRPIDNQELVCDATKFKSVTGWKTEVEIEKTLKDTLDYWRDII